MNFIDMHIHLQDYKVNFATDIITAAMAVGICKMVCAASSEDDWPAVATLANAHPQQIVPAFGIHPWHVATAASGWAERLIEVLKKFPQALIGETGLDGLKENKHMQQVVFSRQIEIAHELKRPLVIHAVKAVSLLENFWRHLPHFFMIHSFNGHPEHLKPILQYGGYISLSASILKNRDGEKIVTMIPDDRLLLETDSPYQAPIRGEEQTPLFLPEILRQIAAWRQQDAEALAAAVYANSEKFINGK